MTRRSKTQKGVAPEVQDAYVTFVEGLLLSQMKGMVRSQDVEERYVALRDRIRDASEQQMATLARTAAEYYVSHAKPGSLGSMTRDEVDKLKKAALDHALKSTT
jgi:hypothetical protein